jgi:adenylate kinase family enzyme
MAGTALPGNERIRQGLLLPLQLTERIAIIGPSGSGKSTLARQLGEKLALPVVHLDAHFWNPGWVETERDAWRETVQKLVERERWIIDGNYSSTMELRLPRAETIIFLDFPRWLCLLRVVRRWLTFRGTTRPDLPPNCPEKVDLAFLRWIWNYSQRSRPRTVALLYSLAAEKQIVWLQSPGAVRLFLQMFEAVGCTPATRRCSESGQPHSRLC